MRDQHGKAQEHEIALAMAARGWAVDEVRAYIDQGVSSRKEKRPKLDELRALASRGKVREVMITKLDRLGRSVVELDSLVREFDAGGCKLIFLGDSIDTSTASGRLLFHVLGSVAEFERDRIRERVLEGLAAAKEAQERGIVRHHKDGRAKQRIGRPRVEVTDEQLQKAIVALARGDSWRDIAWQVDRPVTTIRRAVEAYQNRSQNTDKRTT
jgi:DNA invertase Pin-like site-specific DNA recombinase